ncbi:MAG: 50S ribosomal protein L19 [Candidatus Kapaibacteriales bacterium]
MNKLKLVEEKISQRAIEIKKERDKGSYTEIPYFKPGDVVNVAIRVIEGDKERIQNFKGIVLARRGSGVNETFRVRKISNGIGVERIFPLYSPIIQSITVLQQSKVRRAKLYYLRGMSERKIRQKLTKLHSGRKELTERVEEINN